MKIKGGKSYHTLFELVITFQEWSMGAHTSNTPIVEIMTVLKNDIIK